MQKTSIKKSIFARNFQLLFIYCIFNSVLGGILLSLNLFDFFKSSLLVYPYSIIILTFFVYFGYIFDENWKSYTHNLMAVVSIPLLGLIIWLFHFIYLYGVRYDFLDIFAWPFYLLYTIWSLPILVYFEDYFINNQRLFSYLGLMVSFLPALGVFSGMMLKSNGKEIKIFIKEKIQDKKFRRASKILTSLLLLTTLSFSLVPRLIPRTFTLETYPRVDGATAAIPMAQVFSQQLTGISKRESKEFVRFNTTHEAYVNLINRRADIIFVAEPSKAELEMAEKAGITLKLTPIAKDAFIFIVHKNNPVEGLDISQIQAIYTGEITNWKEVGGRDEGIIAYQRPQNSGSQTLMENRVMKGLNLIQPPKERMMGGMGDIIDAVAEYQNSQQSIGYSIYYYASQMYRKENIKFLALNGISCNTDTIRSGEYPLSGNLYAITREDEPEDSPASKMLQWILSKKGQRAVEKGGFVPVIQ